MWSWDSTAITHDQTCWTYDGYDGCNIPPPVKPRPPISGRGSGPTNGIRPEGYGYRKYHEDVQRESDIIRIKRDDEAIIKLLFTLLSKGIM